MSSQENIFFTIQQIAKILDVVPGTIRNWEKQKLFTARRGENNYRVYDFEDIAFLKRIKDLSIDRRLSYDVIRQMLILDIRENISRAENKSAKNTRKDRNFLSKKWHKFRIDTGKTLEEVSEAVGISPSYLSKIENGRANISYEILERLSEYYNQNILYFFEEESNHRRKIAKKQGTPVKIGIPGVNIWNLVAGENAHIKAMYYSIDPQSGNYHDHSHFGEEFLYVLEGEIEITLNDSEVFHLHSGDSFFFHSEEKHKWINPSDKKAQIIWVYSPFREQPVASIKP